MAPGDLSKLPPKKRAEHYRAMADEAERYAEASTGALKQSYALMAQQWRKLAEQTEREGA